MNFKFFKCPDQFQDSLVYTIGLRKGEIVGEPRIM